MDKKAKINNIHLIVYDFDGVMTDNRVIVSEDGTESVVVNRSDGVSASLIRKLGIPQLILTTETNPVVKVRARKLGIGIIASCEDKRKALENYCKRRGYDLKKVVFVGNDLNDLEVMKSVGFPAAPADACKEVLAVAKFTTKAKGGGGVLREIWKFAAKRV